MTDIPPAQPMTRRERRLLEEQGVLPDAFVAEPTPVAPAAEPAAEPAPLVTPAQPQAPMTRRERKMLEETGVIPIPPEYQQPTESSALQDTSLVEVTQAAPVPAPAGPPEPLPPVFGLPPVEAPTTEAPSETPPAPTPTPTPEQNAPAAAPADTIFPSRVVGDVTMATSSLILPSTPMVDMTGPVGDTGEIIVTGQIALPNRVSETGTIPSMREDRDDEERLDAYVTGELAAMAQPIRAAKAVSGQGDDTDILLVRRVRWGTAAILTATGAAVLGIGAVALLIIALLTDTLV